MEALNIPQTMLKIPRRCQTYDGDCQMFHRGAKYSTERVKGTNEVLNVPRRGSNGPRKC